MDVDVINLKESPFKQSNSQRISKFIFLIKGIFQKVTRVPYLLDPKGWGVLFVNCGIFDVNVVTQSVWKCAQ